MLIFTSDFSVSVTARYVKKKLPSLRRVKNNTMWRTFERLRAKQSLRPLHCLEQQIGILAKSSWVNKGRWPRFTTAFNLVFTVHQLCSSDQKHAELCCWIRFNEPVWCRVCDPLWNAGHVRRRPLHHSSRPLAGGRLLHHCKMMMKKDTWSGDKARGGVLSQN